MGCCWIAWLHGPISNHIKAPSQPLLQFTASVLGEDQRTLWTVSVPLRIQCSCKGRLFPPFTTVIRDTMHLQRFYTFCIVWGGFTICDLVSRFCVSSWPADHAGLPSDHGALSFHGGFALHFVFSSRTPWACRQRTVLPEMWPAAMYVCVWVGVCMRVYA